MPIDQSRPAAIAPRLVVRSLAACGLAACGFAACALTACGQPNQYVAPPPPKVTVARPLQQPFTRYLEATGNTAAYNSVDLVARVSGFLQEINYQDGTPVQKGMVLFTIEPETYKVKLDQSKAAEESAHATLRQTESEFARQADLRAKQIATQTSYDNALAARDAAKAGVEQAKVNTRLAEMNYDYAQVKAPFDGVATAHLVSVGQLVGTSSNTQLASVVQLEPIYVNFNISERDVQAIRADLARRGLKPSDVKEIPVEIGLQSEESYPHKGRIDYASPTVNQSTGTLAVRGVLQNAGRPLLPGYFVRVRVPMGEEQSALLVPETAIGSDQSGRYVLVVDGENTVEQRRVEVGPGRGTLRVIEKGLKPEDRVVVAGAMRAIPGQKVDPQTQTAQAPAN